MDAQHKENTIRRRVRCHTFWIPALDLGLLVYGFSIQFFLGNAIWLWALVWPLAGIQKGVSTVNYYLSIIIFGEGMVLLQPTIHTSPGPEITLVYIWEARFAFRIITVIQEISCFIPSGSANELNWLIFKPTSRIMRVLTHHLDPVMHNSGRIWITWVISFFSISTNYMQTSVHFPIVWVRPLLHFISIIALPHTGTDSKLRPVTFVTLPTPA